MKAWDLLQTIAKMDEQERYDAFGTCYLDDIIRGRTYETVAYHYGDYLVRKYGTYVETKG